jgi:hypothetical protein
MRPSAACRDQLVAHATRERKVGDPVAVQMPELAPAEKELDTAGTDADRPRPPATIPRWS